VLERQIAALAAQLRSVGERLVTPRPQSAEPPGPASAPPPPLEAPRPQPTGASANGHGEASSALTTGESILAAAQGAADEIRAAAEREAERIRAAGTGNDDRRVARLLEIITRQSESLAVLTAEADRIERSAATLRAEVRALGSELREMLGSVSGVARSDH
jgi:hypothetical protein